MTHPFLDVTEPGAGPGAMVLPLPYEGTVSWLPGTAEGPAALLAASTQVELYDELLGLQISDAIPIHTAAAPAMPARSEDAARIARRAVAAALERGHWPAAVGGEHSLSLGVYRALVSAYGDIGVIQLDAHADLRDEYQGDPHSHACVMARIREHTDAVLQLGVRSLSQPEAAAIHEREMAVGFMHHLRNGRFDVGAALEALPERVFLTLDVDALDLSLVRATGTPEPGGFSWPEITDLLVQIFRTREVVGVDLMELCGDDPPSAFVAARLLHRMIGLRFAQEVYL